MPEEIRLPLCSDMLAEQSHQGAGMGIPPQDQGVISWLPFLFMACSGMQDDGVKVIGHMQVRRHTIYDAHLQMKRARLS